MSSFVRIACTSRTFTVSRSSTRNHLRHFASEVSPDGGANLPALSSKRTTSKSAIPEVEPQVKTSEISENTIPYKINPNDKPPRPPRGISLNLENHGLSAFYRKFWQTDTNSTGHWEWTAAEPRDPEKGHSGRSWSAAELRRKSFKDLHTLWYVLLRERNLLASQKEELQRLGVPDMSIIYQTDMQWKVHQCRKSMARIKYVINERRIAYEGAVEQFTKDKALGKIGAVAEQAAMEKMKKGKKKVNAARTHGRINAGRRQTQTPINSGDVPNVAPPTADAIDAAVP